MPEGGPEGGEAGADRPRTRVRGLTRITRTPVFGLAMITPLVFAAAVSATPRSAPPAPPVRDAAVTPLAAVAHAVPVPEHSSGPAVVAIARPPSSVHVAAASISAPPPAPVVYAPGTMQIPTMALSAYRNAEQKMTAISPGCGISWNLLAGIGRIESLHANGGATDARGTALQPIYGPSLDGSLPGNEIIVQSSAPGRVVYARAMGPMQFLPGTWSRYAADGDGDGRADPQNLYDSTLAAARYLCSGGLDLRDQPQVLSAILRYNNSMPYARNVLGWAAAYATGVVPVDLPPIVGPAPPIADMHLEHPEGLGPDSPVNDHGLSAVDPMAHSSLIDLGQSATAAQQQDWSWLPSWLQPAPQSSPQPTPACAMICLEPQAAPGTPMPPYAVPPVPAAPAAPGTPMPPYAVPPVPAAPPAPDTPMPPYAVPPVPAAPMPPDAAPPAPIPPQEPVSPAFPAPAAHLPPQYAVPPAGPAPMHGPLAGLPS